MGANTVIQVSAGVGANTVIQMSPGVGANTIIQVSPVWGALILLYSWDPRMVLVSAFLLFGQFNLDESQLTSIYCELYSAYTYEDISPSQSNRCTLTDICLKRLLLSINHLQRTLLCFLYFPALILQPADW